MRNARARTVPDGARSRDSPARREGFALLVVRDAECYIKLWRRRKNDPAVLLKAFVKGYGTSGEGWAVDLSPDVPRKPATDGVEQRNESRGSNHSGLEPLQASHSTPTHNPQDRSDASSSSSEPTASSRTTTGRKRNNEAAIEAEGAEDPKQREHPSKRNRMGAKDQPSAPPISTPTPSSGSGGPIVFVDPTPNAKPKEGSQKRRASCRELLERCYGKEVSIDEGIEAWFSQTSIGASWSWSWPSEEAGNLREEVSGLPERIRRLDGLAKGFGLRKTEAKKREWQALCLLGLAVFQWREVMEGTRWTEESEELSKELGWGDTKLEQHVAAGRLFCELPVLLFPRKSPSQKALRTFATHWSKFEQELQAEFPWFQRRPKASPGVLADALMKDKGATRSLLSPGEPSGQPAPSNHALLSLEDSSDLDERHLLPETEVTDDLSDIPLDD